jgi:hypothetical protein
MSITTPRGKVEGRILIINYSYFPLVLFSYFFVLISFRFFPRTNNGDVYDVMPFIFLNA